MKLSQLMMKYCLVLVVQWVCVGICCVNCESWNFEALHDDVQEDAIHQSWSVICEVGDPSRAGKYFNQHSLSKVFLTQLTWTSAALATGRSGTQWSGY